MGYIIKETSYLDQSNKKPYFAYFEKYEFGFKTFTTKSEDAKIYKTKKKAKLDIKKYHLENCEIITNKKEQ